MTDPRMTPTNDAPVTVEPAAELAEMIQVGTETGAFDHSPEEIGLHVMENAQAILNALASAPAGDGVARWQAERPIAASYDDNRQYQTAVLAWEKRRPAAALARPRAAVGEQNRDEMINIIVDAIHSYDSEDGGSVARSLAEDALTHILALQSPPAKVEGA